MLGRLQIKVNLKMGCQCQILNLTFTIRLQPLFAWLHFYARLDSNIFTAESKIGEWNRIGLFIWKIFVSTLMAVSPVSRVGTASARLMPYFGRDQSLSSQYFSYMPNSQPIAHFFILKNTTNSTQNFDNYSLTVTKNEKFIE